jgi:hypothetical protein
MGVHRVRHCLRHACRHSELAGLAVLGSAPAHVLTAFPCGITTDFFIGMCSGMWVSNVVVKRRYPFDQLLLLAAPHRRLFLPPLTDHRPRPRPVSSGFVW